jgi:flagellar basal body-associated protein FliL
MAEIKIEQKKQVWPWVLAGLVIAALVIYFLMFRDKENVNTAEVETEDNYAFSTNNTNLQDVKENNSTVAAFVSFVKNDTNRTSLNQSYTNEALLKLTAATNAMAGEIGYDIRADLDRVKASSMLIADETFETSSAKNIRNAVDNSTIALENLQQAKYPRLANEVEELRNASISINPEELTLEQNDAVKKYFAKASDILDKMN